MQESPLYKNPNRTRRHAQYYPYMSLYSVRQISNVQVVHISFSSLPNNHARESDSRNNSNHARARDRSRSTRFGAAARAVVSDVVPLGGDFEDGAWGGVAAVVVVDEEEVGWGAVVACKERVSWGILPRWDGKL
jgi:hypothetical protein